MVERTVDFPGFIHALRLERDAVPDFTSYPFSIPAVRGLETLELDPKVTLLIGENGAGKSTLIEAIAVAAGFNAEGGTHNLRFALAAPSPTCTATCGLYAPPDVSMATSSVPRACSTSPSTSTT